MIPNTPLIVRRARRSLVLALAVLAAGCGGSGFLGNLPFEALVYFAELEPSNVAMAYDPTGLFPQVLGTVTISNGRGTQTVQVECRGDGVFLTVSPPRAELLPGQSLNATIEVEQCPPQPTTFEIRQTVGTAVRTSVYTLVDQPRRNCLAPVADLFTALTNASDRRPFMETMAASPIGVAVTHPDLRELPRVPWSPHTEIGSYGHFVGRMAAPPPLPLYVVRPPGPGTDEEEEEYAAYWLAANGAIALANATLRYAGTFCVDADGDPANNYVPPAHLGNHFGRGTDRWYTLERRPTVGWSLTATDTRSGALVQVPTRAIAFIQAAAVMLLVPLSELGGRPRDYRVAVEEHDDAEAPGGASWSADVAPPVADGLRTVVY